MFVSSFIHDLFCAHGNRMFWRAIKEDNDCLFETHNDLGFIVVGESASHPIDLGTIPFLSHTKH